VSDQKKKSKKPNRKRDKRMTIRGTEQEKKKIEQKAEKAGMSRTEYMIRSALEKKIIDFGNLEDINNLRIELKRIGNNINQIAQKLHQNDTLSQEEKVMFIEEIDDLKYQQDMIHKQIVKLISELG